jgi:hypothetical protein
MPTTATVPARRVFTGEDISAGLRALADLFDSKPYVGSAVRMPSTPQRINVGVIDRDVVDSLAVQLGSDVTERRADDVTFVATETQFDGVLLSVYAIVSIPEVAALQRLTQGETYIGTTTGVLRGARVERDVTVIASRDQDIKPFIRDREGSPDQDRVFVVHPHGSVPQLFVTGSIRPGVSA